MRDCRLGDLEQQAGLARDALEVREQFTLDLALRAGTDVLHNLDQDVGQRVDRLLPAHPAVGGQDRPALCVGMSA